MSWRTHHATSRGATVALASALAFAAATTTAALAAAGDLDPTFGQGGRVAIDYGGYEYAYAMGLQDDGKIVLAGIADDDAGVYRLTAGGALDPSFDGDGRVVIDSGGQEIAFALALQPDGKIVAAGSYYLAGNGDVVVYRLNPDGSFDNSFDGDGRLGIDTGPDDSAAAVALQPDGKIVVVGERGSPSDVVVYRLNTDGSFDTTFDGDGMRVLGGAGYEFPRSVAVQPDGRILVAGTTSLGEAATILRLNPNGSVDAGFAGNGLLTIDLGGTEVFTSVGLQADGKIVVAGYSQSSTSSSSIVYRLSSDGSPDTTFGGNGHVMVDQGGGLTNALALQADGKMLVAGYSGSSATDPASVIVDRLNPDGSLDASFGNGGRVAIDSSVNEYASAIAVQSDGKPVVAGAAAGAGSRDALVYRLQADPPAPTPLEHAREVSLSVGRRARGVVTVTDGFSECAVNVPVKVKHREGGRWRPVGTTTTNDAGAFVVRGTRAPGRYRAIARQVTLASGDVCLADRSSVARS